MANFGTIDNSMPEAIIQTVGSWDSRTCLRGAAWVAMDVQGDPRASEGINFYTSSTLATEVKACLQALLWA